MLISSLPDYASTLLSITENAVMLITHRLVLFLMGTFLAVFERDGK
ncbi:hypothetical protein [Pseudovibrio exalbescens]|nr:hypothetical protein [Pseudovibrio exalbescens]